MTVASEVLGRKEYTGNGSLTTYAYDFLIFATSDLEVYLNGVRQTLTTHYSVTGAGTDSGGNVVFDTAPAASVAILILSSIPLTQTTNLVANVALAAETLEDNLDKLTRIAQQLKETDGRAIKFSKSSLFENVDIPDPTANYFLRWNAAATALENVVTAGSVVITPFMETVITSAATALAARRLLLQGVDGANVASATTLVIPADGDFHHVTGTTTCAGIQTIGPGELRHLVFDGVCQLTHSANFILPGAANFSTSAGDVLSFTEDSTTSRWRCTSYALASGQAIIGGVGVKGADVASTAGVMTLPADYATYWDVTGTNSITGLASRSSTPGSEVTLHFDAAATLVHHSTNLIMPGAANFVCAAGDEFTFIEYATADWRCVSYALASGLAIGGGNSTTDGLYEHSFSIAAAYTITTGNNALSAGPITIGSSGSVTIPATSTWVIA